MSILSSVAVEVANLVGAVTDPDANAPAELKERVETALGLIKWGSLMAVLGILLASGGMVVAGDRGYGGGISPELKSKLMGSGVALVIIGSAAAIVDFLA